MAARTSPATIVVCAAGSQSDGGATSRPAAPVTRVLDLDSVLRRGSDGDGADVALAIDPAWLASRQTLRQALVRARHALPRLQAAVLERGAVAHHAVLAEEGIRVVLVEEFAAVGRGSRRPAPAGWPCRNVAWGVWEVKACPPRRGRGWGWLPGLPAPCRGGLHVVAAGTLRLQRLRDWAARGVARGEAVAITLGELPAVLEGRQSAPLTASVLRAA